MTKNRRMCIGKRNCLKSRTIFHWEWDLRPKSRCFTMIWWYDISIQMGAVTPLHASAWESPRKLMFPLSHRWRGKQICGFRMVRNHWMCNLFNWRCSIESMVFALNLCSRSWSILPSVMLVVCWGVGKSVGTYTRKPHLPAPAYSSWTRVTKHIFCGMKWTSWSCWL